MVKNVLDGLTVGVVKRSRVKWERYIVPTREMVNVYNTFLTIKEARVHLKDPGDDGRTIFI